MKQSEWWRILIAACVGFVFSVIVVMIAERWKERTQKRQLREALYKEIIGIQKGLEGLLSFLNEMEGGGKDASEANFPEFIKAPCFEAAQSSPLFWGLKDSFDIVGVHQRLRYLKERKANNQNGDIITIGMVLNGIKLDLVEKGKINRKLMEQLRRNH